MDGSWKEREGNENWYWRQASGWLEGCRYCSFFNDGGSMCNRMYVGGGGEYDSVNRGGKVAGGGYDSVAAMTRVEWFAREWRKGVNHDKEIKSPSCAFSCGFRGIWRDNYTRPLQKNVRQCEVEKRQHINVRRGDITNERILPPRHTLSRLFFQEKDETRLLTWMGLTFSLTNIACWFMNYKRLFICLKMLCAIRWRQTIASGIRCAEWKCDTTIYGVGGGLHPCSNRKPNSVCSEQNRWVRMIPKRFNTKCSHRRVHCLLQHLRFIESNTVLIVYLGRRAITAHCQCQHTLQWHQRKQPLFKLQSTNWWSFFLFDGLYSKWWLQLFTSATNEKDHHAVLAALSGSN